MDSLTEKEVGLPPLIISNGNEKNIEKDGINNNTATIKQDLSEADKRKLKFRLWKDGIALSVAWLLLYMGYNSISAIQSSLNHEKGLGVAALCVEFALMTLGNLFTDSAIIKRLGCKWTVALGMAVYSIYIAANFYARFYTLVPLAAISGICSAAMWVAQSTYLTRLGQHYADIMGVNADNAKSRFLGILYVCYLGSNVLGNVASSLILGSGYLTGSGPLVDPNAYNPYLEICGAVYCGQDLGTNFDPSSKSRNSSSVANSRAPQAWQVYAFCGFCVGAAILAAIVVAIFVDNLPSVGIDESVTTGQQTTSELLTATVRQWKDPEQLLLIPIGIYNGMDNPFWNTEFTKAFVTCAIGMYFIGFVMVCYGVTAPISSCIWSWLGKDRLRMLPFVVGFLAHFCTSISLLYWMPTPGNVVEMFVLTGVWGVGTGVWSSQVPTYYSIIFTDNVEAAFSNSRIWDAAGRTMSYGWSYPLCTKYKIYIIATTVSCGIIGLFGIEIRRKILKRKRLANTDALEMNQTGSMVASTTTVFTAVSPD